MPIRETNAHKTDRSSHTTNERRMEEEKKKTFDIARVRHRPHQCCKYFRKTLSVSPLFIAFDMALSVISLSHSNKHQM
jgi:hypothetical protein